MAWTQFMDMHSGGGRKLDWEYIYIEAPENEAKAIFYNRFERNPDRVSCTCCGEDYSTTESATLGQATGYERGCRVLETPRDATTGLFGRIDAEHGYSPEAIAYWEEHYYLEPDEEPQFGFKVGESWGSRKQQTVEEYIAGAGVKVIYANEIKPEERGAAIPAEGYVWAGG